MPSGAGSGCLYRQGPGSYLLPSEKSKAGWLQQPDGDAGDTPGVAAAPVALAGAIVPGVARFIVKLSAQAGVFGDIPAGETWSGYPARPHRESLRASAALLKLAGMMRRLEKMLGGPESG